MNPARLESALRAAFRGRAGCAVLLDRSSAKPLAHWRPDLVKSFRAAPGSVLKPLIAAALPLLDARVPCPLTLDIAGVNFDCTHPSQAAPLDLPAALALSCNRWFAEQAALAGPAPFLEALAGADLQPPRDTPALQHLILGARGIRVTPAWLARAYLRLLANPVPPILDGLHRAVAEGTARAAQPAIGGKTGTSREAAFFAGFTTDLLLVVALPGGTGPAHAAPLAGDILSRCAA